MTEEISQEELAQRTLYAVLLGTAELALALDSSTTPRRLTRKLQLALFHTLRNRGLGVKDVAQRLGISSSSAANLSRALKQSFAEQIGVHSLERQIEFMLWAEPLSAARISQVSSIPLKVVKKILGELVAADRAYLTPGRTVRYAAKRSLRLVRGQLWARLDAVGQFVNATNQAIFGRFFATDTPSFARVLMLRVRQNDLDELQALYEEHIWPRLVALDEAAKDDEAAEAIEFTLSWSQYELFKNRDS